MLKGAQMEMADKLGSSLRYAETQNEAVIKASQRKTRRIR